MLGYEYAQAPTSHTLYVPGAAEHVSRDGSLLAVALCEMSAEGDDLCVEGDALGEVSSVSVGEVLTTAECIGATLTVFDGLDVGMLREAITDGDMLGVSEI